jgi:type I restriction enzyme S subunit
MSDLSLAQGWTEASLRELITFVIGGDWGKSPDIEGPEWVDVLCIRASEVRDWDGSKGKTAARRKIKASSLSTRQLMEGDIVIEISGGGPEQPVGRTLLIDRSCVETNRETPKVCTNFFRLMRPSPELSAAYLNWYLRFFYCSREIDRYQGGSNNLRNLKFDQYISIRVPIPPLSEQHRIVAKIEELFSELDKAVENLTAARERLKAYRQSLLKHAFEGKLTADWRDQQPLSESGERLRQRLLIQRRRTWETAELERLRQTGKPPKGDKWKHRYPEPATFDQEKLPALPSEWTWAGLDELVSGNPRSMQSGPFGSNLRHSEFQSTGILVIGIDNVRDGSFSMGSENRISQETFERLDKYEARPGDLLITVMASLGRSCVIPRNLERAIITKHVYRISMEQALVLPEYVNLLLQSGTVSRRRMFASAQGQTRLGLNSSILRALPIPLCSRKEQEEIVDRLNARLSQVEKFVEGLEVELVRIGALRQSILKQAFSGKLVPQDPNDEPASVLLERIRSERAKSSTRATKTKHRTKGEAA